MYVYYTRDCLIHNLYWILFDFLFLSTFHFLLSSPIYLSLHLSSLSNSIMSHPPSLLEIIAFSCDFLFLQPFSFFYPLLFIFHYISPLCQIPLCLIHHLYWKLLHSLVTFSFFQPLIFFYPLLFIFHCISPLCQIPLCSLLSTYLCVSVALSPISGSGYIHGRDMW